MSSLAKFAHLGREPEDPRKLARDAWQNAGLILIKPEWLGNWADRKQAEILAEKVHGKRKTR